MKAFIINKKRIKTAAAMVLCCIMLTSCWENFDDKLISPGSEAPQIKMSSNCILTTTDAGLEWVEPDAVAYKGMKITCTGNGTTSEATVNRGTTAYTITGLNSSYEYTITLTALYSTGYEIECSKFSVTPTAKPLRFMYTAEDLDNARNNLSDYCILMTDIDLSDYSSGTGWNPIGTSGAPFTGIIDGNGHTISNLTINDSTTDYKGFFGYTTGASIKNLTLSDVSVNGKLFVGGLAGYSGSGTISNCSVTGTVSGVDRYVGGMVGHKVTGTIENSYASVNVSSNSISTGGLIGHCDGVTVTNCHATGSVSGSSSVGGLVGYQSAGTITSCYATGNVIIDNFKPNEANAGGLAGLTASITITKCYSLGDVSVQYAGTNPVFAGSLVGRFSGGTISNCFARGSVDARITNSGSSAIVRAGGLVGQFTGTVQYCYNTGTIAASTSGTGTVTINGFAASISGTITACYYNTDTTGRTDTGTGYTYLTTSQMKDSANYTGWDFAGEIINGINDYWSISTSVNGGYPYLTGMVP